MLPALKSSGSGNQPPADAALVASDKQVPDEKLVHSGQSARGSLLRSPDPASQTLATTTTDKPGPGLSKLMPAMEALDTTLRGALQELASRNQFALQAIRETADAVISQVSQASKPGQQSGTAVPGGLPHAMASPSALLTNNGTVASLSEVPSSLAMSPARLNAAMSPTKSAGGALVEAGSGTFDAAGVGATGRLVLGPRWGASEGGRDNMGWVRNLVRYGEASPLYSGDERSMDVVLDSSGTGFRKAVFPSLRPDRREDAGLLAHWLQDMVGQLSSRQAAALAAQIKATPPAPQRSSPDGTTGRTGSPPSSSGGAAPQPKGEAWEGEASAPTSILDLADSVLQVYQVAFDELKRQVGTECKERSALLTLLWEHWSSVVELRTGLASEAKMGAMQAEYTRLMAARDSLSADVRNLNISLAEKDRDLRTAEAATLHGNRSLAGKLAAAQAQAEELNCHYKVADMALSNEVERRTVAEKQLELTKQLLSKSEHEWLGFRAQVAKLESENASLKQQLKAAHNELDSAAAAADTAHREFAALMDTHVAQDVDMSCMRREFETDEILIVSFKQQVRDLEAQLSQLKVFQRDQALKLGAVAADKEALESDKTQLQSALSSSQSHAAELEASLAATELSLAENKAALSKRSEELVKLQALMDGEMSQAAQKLLEVTTELRQTSDTLSDTQHKLSHSESKRRECESELTSVRDMLNTVCRTLEGQGVDGTPRANDKGWPIMGPLGAAQRAIMVSGRQLVGLWERLEACKQEVSVLTQRLEADHTLMSRIQGELHTSRAMEAKVMAAKETAELQLDVAHQAKRVMEAEALAARALRTQLEARVAVLEGEQQREREELRELRPLKQLTKELGNQVEDLSESLRVTSAALASAKEDLKQLAEMQDFYKEESNRLIADNTQLVERVKELVVFESEVSEARGECMGLKDELEDTRQRLDAALAACADTMHQLEIARFFLQGLDLVPPQSPMSSTMSHPVAAGGRPPSAAPGAMPRPEVSWRPTTAPGAVGRPQSARPQGRSRAGQNPEDVQFLNVGNLSLAEEGEGASDGGSRQPFSKRDRSESPSRLAGVNALGGPSLRDLTHSSGSYRGSFGSRSGSDFGGPVSPSALLSAAGFVARRNGGSDSGAAAGRGADRPYSAVSQVSGAGSSVYGADMPPEVMAMLQQRGVGHKLDSSAAKWMKFKVQVMASFSARLRAQLLLVTERCQRLELQLVQQEVDSLQSAIAREQELCQDVVGNLRGQLDRVRHEALQDMSKLKGESLPDIRRDLVSLCSISTRIGNGLRTIQFSRDNRRHAACQSADALEPGWAAFIQSLPQQAPYQPLSASALNDAIVRIYLRALPSVETAPVWGAMRSDTVYDAIMDHYTHQLAPGTFLQDFLHDVESPVARLLRCARLASASTRAGTFANLAGVSPDGTVWPPQTWHFFLHLLHCLQTLLAGTWQSTVRAWAGHPNGAQVPLQAVYDLVGNLYNVQSPTDLERSVMLRLSSIVLPGVSGPHVDMDALLLMLTTEYNAGACPRAALLFPRRITDGALFNLFNTQGHLPQSDALLDGRAAALLSASPPGSPSRTQRGVSSGLAAHNYQLQQLQTSSRPGTTQGTASPRLPLKDPYASGPATPSRPSTALNGVPPRAGMLLRDSVSAGALSNAITSNTITNSTSQHLGDSISGGGLLGGNGDVAGSGRKGLGSRGLAGGGVLIGTALEADGAMRYMWAPGVALYPR